MITDQDIEKMCNRIRFVKGKALTASKAVNIINRAPEGDVYTVNADVRGDSEALHHVTLSIDETKEGENKFVSFKCSDCDNFCRHCVAVAHQLVLDRLNEELKDKLVSARELEQEKSKTDHLASTGSGMTFDKSTGISNKKYSSTSSVLTKIIKTYSGSLGAFSNDGLVNEEGVNIHTLVSLKPKLRVDNQGGQEIEFVLGAGKRDYIIRDLSEFIENVNNKVFHRYGKDLAFVHNENQFTEESIYYIDLIRDLINLRRSGNVHLWEDKIRVLKLTGGYVEEILTKNIGKTVSLNDRDMKVLIANPSIDISVMKDEKGAYIKMDKLVILHGLDKAFVAVDNTIYMVSDKYNQDVIPFIEGYGKNEGYSYSYSYLQFEKGLFLDPLDYASFCGHVLRKIKNYVNIIDDEVKLEEHMPPECNIKMYMDAPTDKRISCSIKAEYGDEIYNVSDWSNRNEGAFRDIEKEQNVYWAVKQYFFEEMREGDDYLLWSEDEEKLYDFLDSGVEVLPQYGEMYVSDSIRNIKIRKSSKVNAGVQIKGNLLELSIDIPDMSAEEIGNILSAYQTKRKYYRLKNGDFIKLNQDSLETIYEMTEGLGIGKKDWKDGKVNLPLYRANYIDSIVKSRGKKISLVRSAEFRSIIRGMREIEDSEYEIPESINAELRGYQKTGYRWLKTLSYYGFGGILADDMGLGKTLQIITLLESVVTDKSYDRKANTSLIACPASLVYNWESEIERFAPNLRARIIVGNADERKDLILDISDVDILVTSYDLLKRDLETYATMSFDYFVIDEAQYIKNPQTQVARAVKAIAAPHRFALTGTPIENKLSDLWSIFDFCMKGYLFTYKKFRDEFERRIVADNDELVLDRLRQMTAPFILRRRKKEVLSDLPDKIEQVVYTSMTDKQKDYYNARFLKLRGQLEGMTDLEYKSGQIELLAEITRLRQVCLDPALFVSRYSGGSGKVDAFYAMAAELTENGSSVLVFSQFAEMLRILNEGLEKEGIKSLILTGSTSKEERKKLVNEFQTSETPTVFLISLKAGGTGLNLTAADTVIHLDPWWNVAAQNQATDRAHRIGQDKVVNVIQLVTKNSIEERILDLQNKKKELAENVIEGDGVSKSNLTREEVLSLLQEF
ncbi:MAG: SNF2 helicase associated domain-containing protein [Lachnospiraceae bacterium]|nr:SNF2 helicase associated domain-containing protein [Lachnospiraceae bacterium]